MQLHGAGLPVSEEDQQKIRIAGLPLDEIPERRTNVLLDGRQHLWLTPEQAAAAKVRVENAQPRAECYLDRIPAEWRRDWKNKDITREDWAPQDPEKHNAEKEFRRFILSHIPRFDRIVPYKMFWLYIEQAMRWLAEGQSVQDFEEDEQVEYAHMEIDRIRENKFYGALKYGFIKDDTQPGGWRKYDASTPQALLFWLKDCKFSGELGKGRQAAITSSMMLHVALTMLTHGSYKGVLVTDDVEFTGKTIFADKLQACIQILLLRNPWLKPSKTPNWSAKKVTHAWSAGSSKQEQRTFSSDYTLAASNETQTINGTTVSEVDFDECQNIPTYQDIKLEARSPMLSTGIDGVIRVARMLWAYGTGSRKQSGGGAFENEYKGTVRKYKAGEYTSTFVPLFFDRTCRPNMTDQNYLKEHDFYMSRDDDGMIGMSKEERMAVFFSAYPNKPEDMFLTSHKHVVPALTITEAWELIEEHCANKGLPVPGRFEPILETNQPMPEGSGYPFLVRDSRWVTHAPDDHDSPCHRFLDRPLEEQWAYRWTQGTDPCIVGSGSSNFASIIFDGVGAWTETNGIKSFNPTFACVLNDSKPNMEDCFNQAALMGMYYRNHQQRACMELVENNRGGEYIRWKCTPQYNLSQSLIYRHQLPSKYQGGGHMYGLDLKNNSKSSSKSELFYDIVAMVRQLGPRSVDGHGGRKLNIWSYEYWTQLYNIEVEEKPNQSMQFGTRNKNAYNDDLVYAGQYAYIAFQCLNRIPTKIDAANPEYRMVEEERLNPNTLELYYVKKRELIPYV